MYQITRLLCVCITLLSVFSYNPSHAEERKAEFLFEVNGSDEIIYVDRKVGTRYKYQVYKGVPGSLQQLTVGTVSRSRNGRRAIITLKGGSFIYIPTPLSVNKRITFKSKDGSVVEINEIQINSDNLDAKRIDPKNPMKAKQSFAVVQADSALSEKSVAVVNENSNPLNARDVKINRAFMDATGDMVVEFKPNAKSLGENRFFWGPGKDRNLYQLQGEGHSSAHEINILAPSDADPKRTAKIIMTPTGELIVSCAGGVRCFRELNKLIVTEVEGSIVFGEVDLEGLPKSRVIKSIFKIEETNRFIVIDSPMFNGKDKFNVYMGEKGHLKQVNVYEVSHTRSGDSVKLQLADGSIIESPVRPYSPYTMEIQAVATLTESKGFSLLVSQGDSVEFLSKELGMDTARYKMPSLRTPVNRCKMVF